MKGSLGKGRILIDTSDVTLGDSIAAYATSSDGTLITHTTIGSDEAMDVNVAGANFTYAEDSPHTDADEGAFVMAVRNDAGTPLAADGDYIPFTTDDTGALRVAGALTVTETDNYAHDSAFTAADDGGFVLAVRRDAAGTQVSADGDYAEFQQNKRGDLRVSDKIETAILQQVVQVGVAAAAIPATALTGRKHIMIQNRDNNDDIYLGSATTTADDTATGGILLGKGAVFEADISDDVDLYAIATSASTPAGVLEMA